MMLLSRSILLICGLLDFVFGAKAGGFSTELGRLYYAFGFYVLVDLAGDYLRTKAERS